jgi:hypothetical protein
MLCGDKSQLFGFNHTESPYISSLLLSTLFYYCRNIGEMWPPSTYNDSTINGFTALNIEKIHHFYAPCLMKLSNFTGYTTNPDQARKGNNLQCWSR